MPLHPERLNHIFQNAVRTFRRGRPPAFDPALEAVFSRAVAPRPTASPAGAVLKGILGVLAGQRLAEARQQSLEEEQRRAEQASQAARRQALEDAFRLESLQSGLKTAGELLDPRGFEIPPSQVQNMRVVTGLFGSPAFIRGQINDPTFLSRALATVSAPNQALRITGAKPRFRPLVLTRGASVYVPGEGLIKPPEMYRPRRRELAYENERGEIRVGLFDELTGQLLRDLRPFKAGSRKRKKTGAASAPNSPASWRRGQTFNFVFDTETGELLPAAKLVVDDEEEVQVVLGRLWPTLQHLSDSDLTLAVRQVQTGRIRNQDDLQRFLNKLGSGESR